MDSFPESGSFAASEVDTGKGFAYQEFLDQLGAFLGPVMLFVINLIKGTDNLFSTYRICFAVLGIPALITLHAAKTHLFPDASLSLLYAAAMAVDAFAAQLLTIAFYLLCIRQNKKENAV